MADVRTLGRVPKLIRGNDADQTAERNLAKRLRKARAAGRLTAEHEAELSSMDVQQPAGDAPQLANGEASQLAEDVMADVRTLGRVPKLVRGQDPEQIAERNLAQRLRHVRAAGRLTLEHEAELATLIEQALGPLEEVDAPPDPLDPFADEAENRLEQDLLMMANGIRSGALTRHHST